jgi:hypothetical protein
MPTGVYDRSTCARKSWKHTEETKQKLRIASTGRKPSPETLEKQRLSHLGITKTTEDRRAISERMKGNKHGLGKRHSAETKAIFRQKARRGPDSNFWKGGTTDQAKVLRSSAEYRDWREKVFKRDDYTCQICDQRGGRLHPDHIKRFSVFPELRFELSNGRTLCESCHKQTPTYGRRKACQSIT